jgi:hypothetical protein
MANASLDLGREEAADDLARAAWTYAATIDHHPLMGWARGTQALAAVWDHRYRDAARHAEDGLIHVPAGPGAARLHAISARALSALGDHAQAQTEMKIAQSTLAEAQRDELHGGLAGEFAFNEAKLRYYQALTLVDAKQCAKAETAAEAAIGLYQAVPARARSYGCEALARVQLATARLMGNKLNDAADSLSGIFALKPKLRISSLNHYLDTCRELLRDTAYRSSPAARRLEQQLADFSAASTARALPPANDT